jgi:biopolymer transport protein ExbB
MNISLLLLQPIAVGADSLDTAGTGAAMGKISVWELILDGGWYIMGPLGVLSILAVYIFIERFMAIRKAAIQEGNFMNKIKDYVSGGKLDAARNLCSTSDTPMARMVEKGISRIGRPLEDIGTSIENVADLELQKLEKGLNTMATIAGAAPMIGFLGTVIGMIFTFHEMSISGGGIKIEELSGGIMQAMVTTVAGLIIGIIAYVGYNVLVSRVEKVVHHMQTTSMDFMDLLHEPGK